MAHTAQGASARLRPRPSFRPSPQQTAIALIGASLIAYRVNAYPEQRAELRGLIAMAAGLGAISAEQRLELLALLAADQAQEVQHG